MDSKNLKLGINKVWAFIGGINGLILILYTVFSLSTAALISVYYTKWRYRICVFIILVISSAVCPMMLRLFSRIRIRQVNGEKNGHITKEILIEEVFFLIPFVYFLIYYYAFYPGGFSSDCIGQIEQAIHKSGYDDWHPVIQTLFAYTLPLKLTRGWIGSIVLFQISCLSAVLGYSFSTIRKYTNMRYTVLSMIFILLNPQLGYLAMYPWKDISFAIGALLLLTFSLHIYISKGNWIQKPLNMCLFIITASLTTLMRHNGVLFTAPLVIAALFFIRGKRTLIIALATITLCLCIRYPIYSAMGVSRPGGRQLETLGLPMTVIGAAAAFAPETMDEETREFAYKVAPREVWEGGFVYGSYNSIKWDPRTNNNVIEEYGRKRVLAIMFKCLKNSKRQALISLIKLTEVSYTLTDKYHGIQRPSIAENNYNIKQGGNEHVREALRVYTSIVPYMLPHVFMFLGAIHLLLITSVLATCRLTEWEAWKKIFFIIPVFAYNYGTTLLLTGVEDDTRFFFYTYLLLPVLLVFIYRDDGVYCIIKIYKVAKQKRTMLHVHFGQSCIIAS